MMKNSANELQMLLKNAGIYEEAMALMEECAEEAIDEGLVSMAKKVGKGVRKNWKELAAIGAIATAAAPAGKAAYDYYKPGGAHSTYQQMYGSSADSKAYSDRENAADGGNAVNQNLRENTDLDRLRALAGLKL